MECIWNVPPDVAPVVPVGWSDQATRLMAAMPDEFDSITAIPYCVGDDGEAPEYRQGTVLHFQRGDLHVHVIVMDRHAHDMGKISRMALDSFEFQEQLRRNSQEQ